MINLIIKNINFILLADHKKFIYKYKICLNLNLILNKKI